MKKRFIKASVALLALTAMGCSTAGDSWDDYFSPGAGTGGGTSSSGTASSDVSLSLSDLSTMTIELNTAALSETEEIPTLESDDYYTSYVENNFTEKYAVSVVFADGSATVSGLASDDELSVDGAYVAITSHNSGMTLNVSGTTSEGQLRVSSDKKFRLNLNSVNIANPLGAAINIQNGNCFVVLSGSSTLQDSSSATYATSDDEDMKGVFFAEDDLRFSGSGSLTITALNTIGKAALQSDDEIFIRPGTAISISATSQAGNGIKANDGIAIKGGVINVSVAAAGAKALSSDGYLFISGGRTTAITTGGVDTSVASDPTGAAAIKADSILTISGGQVYLMSSGQGGKGISADDVITINGGDIRIVTTGSKYGSSQSGGWGGWGGHSQTSSASVSPKGIKGDKDIVINGGDIFVRTAGSGGEGIESKATLSFAGGNSAVMAYDDGTNASSGIRVSGGRVLSMSIGQGDGVDSNSGITVSGGVLIGVASTLNSEDGIDSESGITCQNGTLIGLSSGGMGSQRITGHYVSTTTSGSAGDYVALTSGDSPLAVFQLPRTYSSARLLLSTPTLSSGTYQLQRGVTPSGGTLWMNYYDGATAVSNGSAANVTAR